MKPDWKTIRRTLIGLTLLLLVAGLAAPYFRLDSFGEQIRSALQQALGRRVEIGDVRLNLFTGPGFSVHRVVIHEDPAAGIEPVAYIDSPNGSLEATVSLASLWTGQLQFASLRLNEPSINLVKRAGGSWNFEPLVSRTVGAAAFRGLRLPNLSVRGGRINFRIGDTKSVFYLMDPEVDLAAPSSPGGEWKFRLSGEPARTDKPAHGFGLMSGRGRWRPEAATGGQLDAYLEFEKSSISELTALVHGHDIGVHGVATTRARLVGPVSDLAITGQLEIGDIHRWDLLPSHGDKWPFAYRGRLDLLSQRLELDTVPAGESTPAFAVRFRASDYLSQPRWATTVTLNSLPLTPFIQIARHMGMALPENVSLEGNATGVIGYSAVGLGGTISAPEAVLRVPDSPAVRIEGARMLLDRDRITVSDAALKTAGGEKAALELEYSKGTGALRTSLSTSGLHIAELRSGPARLLGAEAVPVLESFDGGIWAGSLGFERTGDGPGAWSGKFEVRDAGVQVAGIAGPVRIDSARVSLGETGTVVDRIHAQAGTLEFEGDYRYRPKAVRPHQVRLTAGQVEAAELERLLTPSLQRREGLLARALRFGRVSIPDWLQQRHAEGILEFGSMTVAGWKLDKFHSRFRWDGAGIELPDWEARLADSRLTGKMSLNLRRANPAYRIAAQFRDIPWKDGKWDGKTTLQTSGVGPELLLNLKSEGTFSSRSAQFTSDAEFKTISGSFAFGWVRGLPALELNDLQATLGQDVYQGKGSSRDGKLSFDLSDGRKQMRMSGTFSPFQLVTDR
jgi:hypothetical protein